jgi:hypothetical protein
MDFLKGSENVPTETKECYRAISTIKLNYDYHENNDNKRYTCYLTTPSPLDSVTIPPKDMNILFSNYNQNFTVPERTDQINSCLKELKNLKLDLANLQMQIEKKDKENKLKSKTLKHLKATSEKNDSKICKIENLIEKHQEKIIRIEGLMHELDYEQLNLVKEADILGSFLMKNSSMLKKIKINQNSNLSASISPKSKKISERFKIRSVKK